jgi:hypothetical protein
MRVNQTAGTPVGSTGTFGSTILRVGWLIPSAGADGHLAGGLSEVFVANSALSAANLVVLEESQRTYFGT